MSLLATAYIQAKASLFNWAFSCEATTSWLKSSSGKHGLDHSIVLAA